MSSKTRSRWQVVALALMSASHHLRSRAFALSTLLLSVPLSVFSQACPSPPAPVATMQAIDRSEIRPERRQKIQSALASQSYDVITVGDSIMEGWSDARLKSVFGTTVLNSGFGRDGTEHVLWRLQVTDWHGQSPRQVLLLVGTNDLRFSPCDVYWGIRAVVSKVHSVFPNTQIIVTSILPRGQNMLEGDDKIRATNRELHAASAAGGFLFFEPHDAFLCHHQTPCVLFQPDHNLHLTNEGYDLLDDLLQKFLAQNQQRK